MSKNKPHPQPPPAAKKAPREGRSSSRPASPRLAVRVIVSILVVWHVFALFMAPLAIPPTSPLVTEIVHGTRERPSPLQWYLDALYINHGYHFFAPEPGPGHLIRYAVYDEHGEPIAEGEFPDRDEYWPRLRYHRHFMLSDQAVMPLYERSPDEAQQLTLDAYARHLLRVHDGTEARVTRVRHDMLAPVERREGVAIDAPHKYVTVMQRVQRANDLNQPAATAAANRSESGDWQSTAPQRRVR